ncbi:MULTISPECIES: hypothetical protein [unclassified Dysgonomonas]|jgi:hypothetical protein|uniref:hypothetical protein n=1 Tax=unclassified Dysgonomonas TaxID=2630389 RepID=UPI0018846886|nr:MULTISPECIES: hypothetical protein [unclassified Dysgonomonas]MBF0651446.1 hypothetical protein [Dysgonomonas sp. GY75]MDR2003129.1 hypothetical protein [Prevotella sp.]HMM04080.1 hypothetical protein [Dysgonomonas sp.]
MKTLKISGLLVFVIMNFSSCFLFPDHEPETVTYNFGLSFQDTSGNDLVKGIGLEWWLDSTFISEEQAQSGIVKNDLYVLDIIVSEPCKNWDNKIYNTPGSDVIRPILGMVRYNNGYRYLDNDFSLWVNDCPEAKMLTYKLKCPYVFGDEAVHEFVTYWDIPKVKSSGQTFAKCYRIEFNGNEIIPQFSKERYTSGCYIATIILND